MDVEKNFEQAPVDNNEEGISGGMLVLMRDNPADCDLYNELFDLASNMLDEVGKMRTKLNLEKIHLPNCPQIAR